MSNPRRKPRADSNLWTLPEEPTGHPEVVSQREIIERLKLKDEGSYKAVVKWLKDTYSLETSEGALSNFWSRWSLRQDVRDADSLAQEVQALMEESGDFESEQILQAGQKAFLMMGLAQRDPKTFAEFAKLTLKKREGETKARQKEIELQHSERRIKLLEAKAALADAAEGILKDQQLSVEEKHAKLREKFGMV